MPFFKVNVEVNVPRSLCFIFFFLLLTGCIPNTYYDPIDPYARGVRFYDRRMYEYAAKSWEPLLEKDDCDAEYWMGALYFQGKGKKQDDKIALNLWQKAANAGQPKAQAAIGDLYYQNQSKIYHHCAKCDIQKDLVQAYFWYILANKSARYEGEKKYAAYITESILKEMTEDQIKEGHSLALKWNPTPKACNPRKWW